MADALEPGERPTILVVDDMPENLRVMTGLLKDRYKVQVATSGERALKLVAENPPDLVLLDIMMPGMDGYEVCRRLVADPKTSDIPIIFLTGRTQVEDEQMGFELGAADYITKPASPPIVLARVRIQLLLKAARAMTSLAEKIVAGKGKPLDPATADAFVGLAEQIRAITANQ
jgi:putative two-component system response regulator